VAALHGKSVSWLFHLQLIKDKQDKKDKQREVVM